MAANSIIISSGHGKYVRGASGYLDEVDEARRVVERVADFLIGAGFEVKTYHDNYSHSQNENLNRIVNFHNSHARDLDVSVHFNAYQTTSSPMGTECLYVSQVELADIVSSNIAAVSGLKNRGPKQRTDLFFLNNTNEPAILIETCFVDSRADEEIYQAEFDNICQAIAESIAGRTIEGIEPPERPERPERPEPGEPEAGERPTLGQGDNGPEVAQVQTILGLTADGDFGAVTDGAVRGYQAACDLAADGVVGRKTWTALDDLEMAKTAGNDGLFPSQINAITLIAERSEIADYNWNDRGEAPRGYIAGMALCFALAAVRLTEDDDAAEAMAQGDRDDPDTDALSYYRDEFRAIGMDNSEDGIDTLRGLFVMLIGLGMRESSGRYCEGRDMSAENTSAEEAEAGMFQTSWNIRYSSSHIPPLLSEYWENPNGFLTAFRNGVSPDSNDLENYGNGGGAQYQFLSKYAPAFHAFVTAIGMRYLRQHWGPINRNEVELRSEANDMLLEVQNYLSEGSAEIAGL